MNRWGNRPAEAYLGDVLASLWASVSTESHPRTNCPALGWPVLCARQPRKAYCVGGGGVVDWPLIAMILILMQ